MTTLRKVIFANDQIYHVYNRGVEKRDIFTSKREFQRALETFLYYRFDNLPLKYSKFLILSSSKKSEIFSNIDSPKNKLIEIISYCLMPNHFHFLIKQMKDNGISKFISDFTNSYTRFFNTKHERAGPLVQGFFKAVLVENEEQLIHLSRYIHLNPTTSYLVRENDLESYRWSSFSEYLDPKEGFCEKRCILSQFPSIQSYKSFVLNHISYAKELEKVKHLTME